MLKLFARYTSIGVINTLVHWAVFAVCIYAFHTSQALAVAGMSFFYVAWMIVDTFAFGIPVRGYPSLIVSVLFLGGVQLIGIGVLGEYIGRIYLEVKNRPRYILKVNK